MNPRSPTTLPRRMARRNNHRTKDAFHGVEGNPPFSFSSSRFQLVARLLLPLPPTSCQLCFHPPHLPQPSLLLTLIHAIPLQSTPRHHRRSGSPPLHPRLAYPQPRILCLGRRGHKDPSCIFPPPNEFIIPTGYHPPPSISLVSQLHPPTLPLRLRCFFPIANPTRLTLTSRSVPDLCEKEPPPLTAVSWATPSVSDSLLAQFISFHLLPPSISPCCACPAPGTRPS